VNNDAAVTVGDIFETKLRLLPQEGYEYPKEVKLSLRALATEYTGRGRNLLGSTTLQLEPAAAQSDGIMLTLDTNDESFFKMFRGTGFPLIMVGTAVWSDPNAAKETSVGKDPNTVSIVIETGVELVLPPIELISTVPPASFDQISTVTLTFANPLNRPLTAVQVLAENPRLMTKPKRLQLPDVPAGEKLNIEVEIKPRRFAICRDVPLLLAITVVTAELEGIYGSYVIEPKS